MADLFKILSKETKILEKFIYRVKNEHKTTITFRKTVHLKRLLRKYEIVKNITNKKKVLECCLDLYVLASNMLDFGHYVGFTFVLMGLCSRIHFIVSLIKLKKDNEIENDNNKKNIENDVKNLSGSKISDSDIDKIFDF